MGLTSLPRKLRRLDWIKRKMAGVKPPEYDQSRWRCPRLGISASLRNENAVALSLSLSLIFNEISFMKQ